MPASIVAHDRNAQINATIPVWSSAIGSWNFSVSRNPFQTSELEGHYDKSADSWQSKIEKLGFVDAYHKLITTALQQSDICDNSLPLQVLDAGIGTGAMSAAFSNLVSCDVDLLGVDLSSKMLGQARNKIRKPNINMHTLKADLSELPISDDTFDVILMAHVVEHLADPIPVLSELNRVLKPGGIMIACITRRSPFGRYIQLVWRTHQVESETAQSWMSAAGFEALRILPLDKKSGTRRRSIGYLARKAKTAATNIGGYDGS